MDTLALTREVPPPPIRRLHYAAVRSFMIAHLTHVPNPYNNICNVNTHISITMYSACTVVEGLATPHSLVLGMLHYHRRRRRLKHRRARSRPRWMQLQKQD